MPLTGGYFSCTRRAPAKGLASWQSTVMASCCACRKKTSAIGALTPKCLRCCSRVCTRRKRNSHFVICCHRITHYGETSRFLRCRLLHRWEQQIMTRYGNTHSVSRRHLEPLQRMSTLLKVYLAWLESSAIRGTAHQMSLGELQYVTKTLYMKTFRSGE